MQDEEFVTDRDVSVEADGEPNTVITVLQKGYLLHERTLRPALVVVSKAKSAA